MLSMFNREMKGMARFFDVYVSADASATNEIFNWQAISFKKTIVDTSKSIAPQL